MLKWWGYINGPKSIKTGLVVLIQYQLWQTASQPPSHVAVANTRNAYRCIAPKKTDRKPAQYTALYQTEKVRTSKLQRPLYGSFSTTMRNNQTAQPHHQKTTTRRHSFNGYSPGKPIAECLDKDDVRDGGNWSYKACKAPVKSPPSTNQHPLSEKYKKNKAKEHCQT